MGIMRYRKYTHGGIDYYCQSIGIKGTKCIRPNITQKRNEGMYEADSGKD